MLQRASDQGKRFINNKATKSIRTSYLEIEKKFGPSASLKRYLDSCASGDKQRVVRQDHGASKGGAGKDLRVVRLPDKKIRDVYYDLNGQLSSKGIWIRYRETKAARQDTQAVAGEASISTAWEAKIRVAGTYTDTQAVEVEGKEQIKQLLRDRVPEVDMQRLEILVDVQTFRRSWLVEEEADATAQHAEMRIDLDTVTAPSYAFNLPGKPFVHEVGEIEMTGKVAGGETGEDHDELRRRSAESMRNKVQRVFERYPGMFATASTQGKLSAFFTWKKKTDAKLGPVDDGKYPRVEE